MKSNRFRIIRWSVLGFLLFTLACGHEESSEPHYQTQLYPNPLKVIQVKETPIPIFYEAVGTVKAKTSTTLSSKIPGNIKEIAVAEGDAVRQGQTLITIDDRTVREQLKQAQAGYRGAQKALNEIDAAIQQATAQKKQAASNMALAQTNFKRFQQLIQEKAISQQEFDQAKTQWEVSQAQLQAAEGGIAALQSKREQTVAAIEAAKAKVEETTIMKSYTVISAPFDGLVVTKHVEIGSLAVPGTPLLTIERPEGFRLEVDVREEEFVGKAEVGRQVATQIDAIGNQIIYGHVAEAVPSVNAMSRTFRVKIALPDVPGLKSGMYGKAMCARGLRNGILIPASSLIRRGQLELVYIVDNNHTAHLRLVKSGKTIDNHIEILAGVKTGETLIVAPPHDLRDRNQVKVEVVQ